MHTADNTTAIKVRNKIKCWTQNYCTLHAQHAIFSEVQHYYIRRHESFKYELRKTVLPYSRKINTLREFMPSDAICGPNHSFISVMMRPHLKIYVYNP